MSMLPDGHSEDLSCFVCFEEIVGEGHKGHGGLWSGVACCNRESCVEKVFHLAMDALASGRIETDPTYVQVTLQHMFEKTLWYKMYLWERDRNKGPF